MYRRQRIVILLAALLWLFGLAVIVVVSLPQTLLLPENTFLISLIILLSIAVLGASFLLIREVIKGMWQMAVEQMRAEALNEHHRFLRRLDHELKNPLTALRAGLASLTLTLSQQEHSQIVNTLADEAQRLSHLVTDLRKLAELEAHVLDIQLISAHDLCTDIAAFVEERMALYDRHIQVHIERFPAKLPMLTVDADLLLLAVHNLLDNAVKYTRDGDQITVRMRTEADDLVIDVIDSGIGIPEGEQTLVWEELYRGKNASRIPGSGIGLALVKTIVARHNGDVHLESRFGTGTTVSIHFPLN